MNPIIMALLAMSTDFNSNYQCDPLPPKKCFRHGCENYREGNKLYCSKQCRELHLLAGNMPRDTELPITKIPDQGVITYDTSNT